MKINEYVRIKDTGSKYLCGIGKIVGIVNKERPLYKIDSLTEVMLYEEAFSKHSSRLIDLVEIGDCVNGEIVCAVENDEDIETTIFTGNNYNCFMADEDIESVITKEQMEAMKYEVKDE